MATKAVHIEMLNTLETDSFINALMRFAARRGEPKQIRCDNGTNFRGAFNETQKELDQWNKAMEQKLAKKGIEWLFNTPNASHQGGLWERMIRATRRILNVTIGKSILDDERLATIFCEVEGILNNRPLTPNPDDPTDDEPLTPNHLLLMRKGSMEQPGKYRKQDEYTKRWRHCQYIADRFWSRWLKEYIPIIQHRSKWLDEHESIQEGDLVLLCDEIMPRNNWPLGRVTAIHRGRDGKIRSATVKTSKGSYDRPVTKLCLLEETKRSQ